MPDHEQAESCPDEGAMVAVCELPNGCTLYRKPNQAGGQTYWSDEVGGGVVAWDTSLVDPSTLLTAMAEEDRRARQEARERSKQKARAERLPDAMVAGAEESCLP